MHSKAVFFSKFLLITTLLADVNGENRKNFNAPNFLTDVFIKFARNFWKSHKTDPIVIKGFTKNFQNDLKNPKMNLTILMLTERHGLKGISDIARNGDTKLIYKPSSIDLEFNCTIAYLRWCFNYAVNFIVHSRNLSWISVGRKEHYISNAKVYLGFSIDLKSRIITLKKLSIQKDIVVSENAKGSTGKTENNETRFAMDFRKKVGKKFLRGLIKNVLKTIVVRFLNAFAGAML